MLGFSVASDGEISVCLGKKWEIARRGWTIETLSARFERTQTTFFDPVWVLEGALSWL
jgi:hypothetical protein